MKEFKLTDIAQLDNVTYDEIDNLLKKYEETRVIVEYQLKKFGSLDEDKTYEDFDDFMAAMPQTRDNRRRRAIAEQIFEYYRGR